MKVLITALPTLLVLAACGTGGPSQETGPGPNEQAAADERMKETEFREDRIRGQSRDSAGAADEREKETEFRAVQPGAPGESTRPLDPDELAAMEVPGHTQADVRFMQGMIPHHAQALEMVALMPDRTGNPQLLRMGQRIQISQRDEIALMQRWLRDRGEVAPDVGPDGEMGGSMGPGGEGHAAMHGPAGHGAGMLMPGMLTPEQMAELAAARDTAFDRLFLEYMIQHHEGARHMVRELFSTPGGGQESFSYQFATDVDVDQEMEIQRMQRMLDAIP